MTMSRYNEWQYIVWIWSLILNISMIFRCCLSFIFIAFDAILHKISEKKWSSIKKNQFYLFIWYQNSTLIQSRAQYCILMFLFIQNTIHQCSNSLSVQFYFHSPEILSSCQMHKQIRHRFGRNKKKTAKSGLALQSCGFCFILHLSVTLCHSPFEHKTQMHCD